MPSRKASMSLAFIACDGPGVLLDGFVEGGASAGFGACAPICTAVPTTDIRQIKPERNFDEIDFITNTPRSRRPAGSPRAPICAAGHPPGGSYIYTMWCTVSNIDTDWCIFD